MNKNITLNFPINQVSFGNVSIGIIRELFDRNILPNIFPIGPADVSAQNPDEKFNQILSNCINFAQTKHDRSLTSLKLWHINGALESYSRKDSRLITFFELDSLTPTEINILKSQDKIYVSSKYTQSVFDTFGVNSEYLPLGFDKHNFKVLEKRPLIDGVTSFMLAGKLEKRKGHFKILNLWAKKYGNNMKYRLNCAISNPFLKPEHQQSLINQALEGKQYANINFIPHMQFNSEYNAFLQSGQIVIAMSGGEGKGLPEYHATALGAWPVALNGHAYKDYFNSDNAILVNPNSKIPAADGIFFANSGPFNIGNLLDFNGDEFISACEQAEKKAETGINQEGLKLQNITYKDTVDILLKDL